MRRRPNTQTVQWFLEMHLSGQLDLNPTYQRRSVWNDEYRRYYMDSVLRDYPSPAIYLETETKPGFPTIHHVIDGKQRLETLIAFTNDEFHLGALFSGEGYDKPYYSDLNSGLQDALADYTLSVENITRSTPEEIRSAFSRLNRNTAKLNRQELRKAQYEGAFISKMTLLAEDPLWTTLGIATRTRISRMQDVAYVSEIYLLTMHGVIDGNDNRLDDYYAAYDEDIESEDETDAKYRAILNWIGALDLNWSRSRWTNVGDFYSLWAAGLELVDNLPDRLEAAARLANFEFQLDSPKTDDERHYSDAVRQGTNKESARKTRAEIITRVLTA